jgi:hypothetical protein
VQKRNLSMALCAGLDHGSSQKGRHDGNHIGTRAAANDERDRYLYGRAARGDAAIANQPNGRSAAVVGARVGGTEEGQEEKINDRAPMRALRWIADGAILLV